MLELIQQRAEQWSASNLATVIFNSGMLATPSARHFADLLCKDDYWIYERLKQYATRMNVIRILDLDKQKALAALRNYRTKYRNDHPSESILEQVYGQLLTTCNASPMLVASMCPSPFLVTGFKADY